MFTKIYIEAVRDFRTAAISFILLLFISSCNPENRIQQTPALKQEIADKKVKRITDIQISETVDSWGKQLTAIIQKELTDKLTHQSADMNKLCQLKDLPKTNALAKRYNFTIELLGASDVQNPKLPQKEREVLDAYLYNAENKLPQPTNIQKINDTLFVYNTAVPADNLICKACFGDQKQPLAVWRLVFHKREVIRRIGGRK